MSGLRKRALKKAAEQAAVDTYAPVDEIDALNEADDALAEHTEGADDGLPEKNGSNDSGGTLSPATLLVTERPCALDSAPVNSKVVVVMLAEGKEAVFTTSKGVRKLDPTDIAWRLPNGAKVIKVREGEFHGVQLNPAIDYPVLVRGTAREVMEEFVAHFHRN